MGRSDSGPLAPGTPGAREMKMPCYPIFAPIHSGANDRSYREIPMRMRMLLTLFVTLLTTAIHAQDIVIGEYGSLTGGTATFGISTDEGIKLALDEINAAGGVLGKKVRV